MTISRNISVNFYANPLASLCDAIWSSSPLDFARRRYEIVPSTQKMSACQPLKACNLLGMFLLVCVTVVREPHAQACSNASLPPTISLFLSLKPASLCFLPRVLLIFFFYHTHTHTHRHAPCLFLRRSRLSGCNTGALMYYHISGGPCPLDKRLFNTI